LFLDNTLRSIIKRFEDEYPETRVASAPGVSSLESPSPPEDLPVSPHSSAVDPATATANGDAAAGGHASAAPEGTYFQSDSDGSLSDGGDAASPGTERKKRRGRPSGMRSRQASDVSLAAKKLAQEEGTVHRLGTEVRRKMLERASAEAEKAEACDDDAAAEVAVGSEAAEATAAIIDAEKEERPSEAGGDDVRKHVRALKETLRALDSAA
jgi:hypothetical protein